MDLADAKEAYKKLDEMLRQDQEQRDKKCSPSAPTKKNGSRSRRNYLE